MGNGTGRHHQQPYGITAVNIDIMIESSRRTLVWDNIPEWAIFALEYGTGEEQSMTDEDREMISRFTGENFPDGYTLSVDWESFKEFDTNPAFGKACKTYKVTFITES